MLGHASAAMALDVYAGLFDDDLDGVAVRMDSDGFAPLPPDVERYRQEGGLFNGTIFQVGHFFALAFQHDWPGLRTYPKPESEAVDALPQIWPIGPTVHWPPPTPVDDLGDLHKVTRFLQISPPLAPVSGP
jgi:hypothetical protein